MKSNIPPQLDEFARGSREILNLVAMHATRFMHLDPEGFDEWLDLLENAIEGTDRWRKDIDSLKLSNVHSEASAGG